MFRYIFIVIFFSGHSAFARNFHPDEFEDCGSTALIREIRIPQCQELPCELRKRNSYRIEIDFHPQSPDVNLLASVTGIIMRMEMPWPGGVKSNACQDLKFGTCPFNYGDRMVYAVDLNVLQFYPSISVLSKWRLYDSQGKDHVCLLIPVKIR